MIYDVWDCRHDWWLVAFLPLLSTVISNVTIQDRYKVYFKLKMDLGEFC